MGDHESITKYSFYPVHTSEEPKILICRMSRWQRQNKGRDLYSVTPEHIFRRNTHTRQGAGGKDGETCICDKDIPTTANSQKNTGAGWLLFQKLLFVRNMLSLILKENKKSKKRHSPVHGSTGERTEIKTTLKPAVF